MTDFQLGSVFGALILFVAIAASLSVAPRRVDMSLLSVELPPTLHSTVSASWWQWATEDPAMAFTLGLVIVAVAQAGLFFWQLVYMRRGLADSALASHAARDAAKAADESTQIARLSMISGNRAYVHYNGCRNVSHLDENTRRIFWRIRPSWTNSGNTPTRNLKLYVHYELTEGPLSEEYLFSQAPHTEVPATIPPKGYLESQPLEIFGEDLLLVKQRKRRLYVWGVATYRDVFPGTPVHATKFCVEATSVFGNPLVAWHEKDNLFEMFLSTYYRHNCADEECED